MKKVTYALFFILSIFLLSSCGVTKNADIVTTMFPQYDFASQIVKDKMTVSLLLPPGVEVHSYEASSKDMVAIKNAKLFIYTSLEIDTWIKDSKNIGGKDTVVMNLSEYYKLEDHDHIDPLSLTIETNDQSHNHNDELHYWVDPLVSIELLDSILEEIVKLDPTNEDYYRMNASLYHNEILEVHEAFDALIQNGYVDSKIFFAGHNALGLFGSRYHLDILSLFESFKPDADLTSKELVSFTSIVLESDIHYLFVEELAEPKAALQIKEELSKDGYVLEILELHAYHNITKKEMEKGVRYVDLLLRNTINIKKALHINHD